MVEPIALANIVLLCSGTLIFSFIVSAIGPSGGLQMVVTAVTLPPQIAIPVHAWIAGFAAVFRTWNLRRHISWHYLLVFSIVSFVASAVAVSISASLPGDVLKSVIGAYIILSTLLRIVSANKVDFHLLARPDLVGGISGFVTVFVGATGPLVFSLMASRFKTKEVLQGIYSSCLIFQHFTKIFLFGLIGTSIFQYPFILVSTLVSAWLGTWLGHKVLISINERTYWRLLNTLLLGSGVFLIVSSLGMET